jgi:hypothetical protein
MTQRQQFSANDALRPKVQRPQQLAPSPARKADISQTRLTFHFKMRIGDQSQDRASLNQNNRVIFYWSQWAMSVWLRPNVVCTPNSKSQESGPKQKGLKRFQNVGEAR